MFTLFLLFVAIRFFSERFHLKLFFFLLMVLPWAFYCLVPAFGGPRNFFSSGVDLVYLFLLAYFLVRHPSSRLLTASVAAGLLINVLGFLYTCRGEI